MSAEILAIATGYSLYSGCITFTLGIIGHCLNILVFTRLKQFRNNRCAFYLTIESISSLFYQLISITLTILTTIYGDDATGRSLIWCRFRYILAHTSILTTSYTISFVAIDEFFSTNYRFDLRCRCTLKIAQCLTSTFICIWIIHSITFSFFLDVQPLYGCLISNPIFLRYSTYFFYPVLSGLLPVVIASFFGLMAFRNVRRIVRRQLPIVRRQLDRQMTAMILMRIIAFFFFVLPYTNYRIYIINFPLSRNKPMEYAVGRLIQAILVSIVTLNYTMSFYVYVILSTRFRRQVKSALLKQYRQRWTRCCGIRTNRVTPCTGEVLNTNMERNEHN